MKLNETAFRGWVYADKGDYHRNLDPNWSYAPTYLSKLKAAANFITTVPKTAPILDACCGEGVLVEKFRADGWNISGIDLNYESDLVARGNVKTLPFKDNSHAGVLFLDALEHLTFDDQSTALRELLRILYPGGKMLLAVPNIAHLNSRVVFLVKGKLDRTDSELNHVGERPIWENKNLIEAAGFVVDRMSGITLTIPLIYKKIICRQAAKYLWLHDAFEPVAKMFPSLAMLTLFYCTKPRVPMKAAT
jgi:ubiquinone/menaquinone biosynthesis C-methylase UbiE